MTEPPGRNALPGQARRVAAGALTQQAAQAAGLIVLLLVVTVLARRLSLAELGTYGLVATLAVYLLVLRNSLAGAAIRAMVAAHSERERAQAFSTAAVLYAGIGLATGLLIAAAGVTIATAVLEGDLEHQAQLGALVLAAVTAVGLAVGVNLDALRGALLLTRSAANEILALAGFAALMLGLVAADAPLWLLIGASGSIPLLSGTVNLVARRRLGLSFRIERGGFTRERARQMLPAAGWLLVIELSTLVAYGLDRLILGAFTSPATIGLYEGPIRAHNVLYALSQSVGVTGLPTATGYAESGDRERMRSLVVRGSRYTLALFVPLTVTAMALAAPALGAWLGQRYREAAPALTILVSYWLLYGSLAVTPSFLVGAGRAREAARLLAAVAAANLALTLALTPVVGLEGPALGTAIPFVIAFPFLLRIGLSIAGASLAELARAAWLPAYSLGAALAGLLVAARLLFSLDSAVALVCVLLAAPLAYWAAYAAIWLSPSERRLVRDVVAGYLPRRGCR